MSAIPAGQANATLLKVGRGGFAADFDREETADTPQWEGAAKAYYREQVRRDTGPEGGVIVTRSLILDSREPGTIEFQADDEVEFRFKGTVHTGKVVQVEEKEIRNVPGVTRLILEPR